MRKDIPKGARHFTPCLNCANFSQMNMGSGIWLHCEEDAPPTIFNDEWGCWKYKEKETV